MSGDQSEGPDEQGQPAAESGDDRAGRISRLAAVGAFAVPVVASFAMADTTSAVADTLSAKVVGGEWQYGGGYAAYWSNATAIPPCVGPHAVLPANGSVVYQTTLLSLEANTTKVRLRFAHTAAVGWDLSVDAFNPHGVEPASGSADLSVALGGSLPSAQPATITFTGQGDPCQIDNVELFTEEVGP